MSVTDLPLNTPFQDGLPTRQRVAALIAISLAVAMANLDTAITNTALPTIAMSIRSSPSSVIWVVNAYQLAMVATLLPFAALGEIHGHRRVYITGLTLFTASSLGCGLAWSLPTLVTARAMQGVGAAAIMSVNTALIRFSYPLKLLGRGVGLNALVVAVSFTLGPSVASAILSVASWNWLFLTNVPLGVFSIALATRTLPITHRARYDFDIAAAMLCATFFALLILGLGTISHEGVSPIVIVVSLPPQNESLAERLNSSKESQEDEQDDAGALHARIQAGSGSAGQGRSERCGGRRDAGFTGAVDFQLAEG
ncbi:MFS transporter [Trinickia sp. NRRL B-1857]|uniref:MFS transporter n=1 Tax=Trinickia sp. NRRL B-1857 TaxID=3162879 RepID=UPI003D28B339